MNVTLIRPGLNSQTSGAGETPKAAIRLKSIRLSTSLVDEISIVVHIVVLARNSCALVAFVVAR